MELLKLVIAEMILPLEVLEVYRFDNNDVILVAT